MELRFCVGAILFGACARYWLSRLVARHISSAPLTQHQHKRVGRDIKDCGWVGGWRCLLLPGVWCARARTLSFSRVTNHIHTPNRSSNDNNNIHMICSSQILIYSPRIFFSFLFFNYLVICLFIIGFLIIRRFSLSL